MGQHTKVIGAVASNTATELTGALSFTMRDTGRLARSTAREGSQIKKVASTGVISVTTRLTEKVSFAGLTMRSTRATGMTERWRAKG